MTSGSVLSLMEKRGEAARFLKSKVSDFPRILIVLGSGLSDLVEDMEKECVIPFSEIPHFKKVTVAGHIGQLVVGRLEGTRVACMQGRYHFYEGHTMEEVVFPFRAFGAAGCEAFLLTNASGGLQPGMNPMDLLLIRDHINLMGTNPLIGPNEGELGPRFPDLTHLYDPSLRKIFRDVAQAEGIPLREGVYIGIHGPSYETPAEINMYRVLGGDVVGMSTVPEAIAIHHMGKKVVAISCITNLAAGATGAPLAHAEVLENAKKAYGRFSRLVARGLQAVESSIGKPVGHGR